MADITNSIHGLADCEGRESAQEMLVFAEPQVVIEAKEQVH
jgi:hypothetical protein